MTELQMVQLIERLSNHVGELSKHVVRMDGAQIAQRHALGLALSMMPDNDVRRAFDDLIAEGDAAEDDAGMARTQAYCQELDRILIEAQEHR